MSDSRDKFVPGGALDVYASVTRAREAGEQLIGRQLGDYRITGLLAEGGMGQVFRAARVDGSFEREVAIKISPGSGLNRDLRERFLREQSILAGLNHPNICQLFDAGIMDEGWPYLVMELVDGEPIDEYCRARRIGPNAVVGLMTQIADAMAFAHARLVVHRDLKPSNVMVTPEGRPKILDFGIAKLLDPDVVETQARPMTPRYASPEQLLGREVTIASDVYQLGALLGELLTGRPVQADESVQAAMERAAAARPVTMATAGLETPRELRLIAEQCLRADPAERYADANALKRDLDSYLAGRPVAAVGLTPGYRLRKFLQRNVRAIAASAAAGLVLAAGIQLALFTVGSNPCPDPGGRLTGIWDDGMRSAVVGAFRATGLAYAEPLALRVVGELDRYVRRWREMHVDACEANRVLGTQSDALLDKRMMCLDDRLTMLGALTRRFAAADAATLAGASKTLDGLASLERCAEIEHLTATVGPPPAELRPQVSALKTRLAELRADYETNHVAEAAAGMPAVRAAAGATAYAPLVADAELLAGQILSSRSDERAGDAYATAISNAALAGDDYRVAEGWIEYVYALSEQLDDPSAARTHLLSARTAVLRSGDDPALAMRLQNIEGALAFRGGDYDLARDSFARALAIARGAGLARTALVRLNLAAAHRELGELDRARVAATRSLDELTDREGPNSPQTMRAVETLAVIAKKRGDYQTLARHSQRVLEVYSASLGPRHEKVANAKRELAWAAKELGRLPEALTLMEEALEILEGLDKPPGWAIASLYNDLGDLRMYLNDLEGSERDLRASLAIWGRDPENTWASFPLTNLGFLGNRTGRFEEALESCSRALALERQQRGENNADLAYPLSCIGEALLGLGRPETAIDPLAKSVELRATRASYELGWSRFLLGHALLRSGRAEAARQELAQALTLLEAHPPPDPHMAGTVERWGQAPSGAGSL